MEGLLFVISQRVRVVVHCCLADHGIVAVGLGHPSNPSVIVSVCVEEGDDFAYFILLVDTRHLVVAYLLLLVSSRSVFIVR
jgi:hypothetical protein